MLPDKPFPGKKQKTPLRFTGYRYIVTLRVDYKPVRMSRTKVLVGFK